MALHVLGINQQTAPVALRERVAFAADSLAPALDSLRALPQVQEAVLLFTCNRTEFYRLLQKYELTPGLFRGNAGHVEDSEREA